MRLDITEMTDVYAVELMLGVALKKYVCGAFAEIFEVGILKWFLCRKRWR